MKYHPEQFSVWEFSARAVINRFDHSFGRTGINEVGIVDSISHDLQAHNFQPVKNHIALRSEEITFRIDSCYFHPTEIDKSLIT